MADKLKERISLLEEAEARAQAMGKTLKPEAQSELDTYRKRGLAKTSTTASTGNASVEERKANSFLLRALGSNTSYEKTGVGPRSLLGQSLSDSAPNVLNSLPSAIGNSDERQVSDSAQNEFIAASLRQDSGAAIPPAEMENQRRIYFPMPGDSAAAIEQKRQARIRAIEGLYSSAGRALTDDTRKSYAAFMKIPVEGVANTAQPAAPPPLEGDPAKPTTSAPIFDAMNAGAYGHTNGPETIDTEYKGVDNPELRAKNEQVLAAVAANQPDEQILALAQRLGVDPAATGLNAILAYRKKTGLTKYADTTDYQTKVPLTGGEKVVNTILANPATAFAGNAVDKASFGVGTDIATSIDPTLRRSIDAVNNTNPRAAIAGNTVGTIASSALAEMGAARFLAGTKYAPQAARIGDFASGALSGFTGNPDDRVVGALKGGVINLAGGEAGRGIVGGVANVVSPTGGKFADLYADGVRPTLGQRFAGSNAVGDGVNGLEQAAGSVPFMGAAVRGARADAMESWERAGINRSLRAIGEKPLPRSVKTGPDAFGYAKPKFDKVYDDARSGMQFLPDSQFGTDVGQWQARWKAGVLSADQEAQVERVIANNVGDRLAKSGGVLSGEKYKLATTALDDAAASTDSEAVRSALKDYSDILKAGASRVSDPAAVSLMKKADEGWSLYKPLALAAGRAGSEPGRFTPAGVAGVERVRFGKTQKYIEGNTKLNDYVSAGLGMRDTLGNSADIGKQTIAALALGTSGAVSPTIPAGAVGLTLPYLPGVRKIVPGLMAPSKIPEDVALAAKIRANYQPAGGPVGQGLLDAYLEQRRMQNQPGLAGAYR